VNYTYIRVKKKFYVSPGVILPTTIPRRDWLSPGALYVCRRGEIYKTNTNPSYLNSALIDILSIVDVLKLVQKDKNALKKLPEML
jgi:hypothetical protein